MDTRTWSRNFVLEFIELYRSYSCLWKINSPEYSNKILKNKAYEELIKKVQEVDNTATKITVKRKIDSMRGSFRKEIKKIKQSKKSGAGSADIYKPHLWYFDYFLFLEDQEICRESHCSIIDSDAEDSIQSTQQNELQLDDESSVMSPPSLKSYCITNMPNSSSSTNMPHAVIHDNSERSSSSITRPSSPCYKSVTRKPKRSKSKADDIIDKVYKELNREEDNFDVIGKNFANKLRDLPKQTAILAEKLMTDILFEAQLGNLGPNSKMSIQNGFNETISQQDTSHNYQPLEQPLILQRHNITLRSTLYEY